MSQEPNYTLTIVQGESGFAVCEAGDKISIFFLNRRDAENWMEYHRRWMQPKCCYCGSAVTRPDDPWEAYGVSSVSGADWMHQSCIEKFEATGSLQQK